MHDDQPSNRRPRDARYLAGVSLVELVVSMAIMSVLISAMGSAVFLATKALPDPDSPTFITLDTGQVASDIVQDLRYAVTFIQRLPNLVEFTVADRDNDLAPETILYQWSGTPGDPLTRQYNGGTVVNVIDSIQQFSLTYNFTSVVDTTAQPPVIEGAEQLFLQQDDTTTNGTFAQFQIDNIDELAQTFQPNLPVDTDSWRITRVQYVPGPQSPVNGTLAISIRPAAVDGTPSATIVEEILEQESNFSNIWYETVFANADNLDPTQEYFVVFTHGGGPGAAAKITIDEGVTNTPNTLYYSNGVEDSTKDIRLWVWGTVSTPDPAWVPPTINTLQTVTIGLQAGDSGTAVELETAVRNQPVLP